MRIRVGTSGFSYKAWKGAFYPEELSDGEMLHYYAGKLGTVEINNTFYRMPRAQVLQRWAQATGAEFRFVLKASQRITHRGRLRADACREAVDHLWKVAQSLGPQLGPILFQTPPNLKWDHDRFRGFLDIVPRGMRAAFEFRHPSWDAEEVREALGERECALCIAETDEAPEPALHATANWGYLRLRRESYDESELRAWRERLRQTAWDQVYLFFKHDEGAAPVTALRFVELCSAA